MALLALSAAGNSVFLISAFLGHSDWQAFRRKKGHITQTMNLANFAI